MNQRQLQAIGIPVESARTAIDCARKCAEAFNLRGKEVRARMARVAEQPAAFSGDPHWGPLADELLAENTHEPPRDIHYRTWGSDIDDASHAQMRQACQVPSARAAALMPDAHVGYGLPIGGVLALENAVVPYAVGVDIACRMKLSILDMPRETLETKFPQYRDSLERGTHFGVGGAYKKPRHHAVLDADWTVSKVTRESRDKAWKQLGTSGSGNHFAEFGVLRVPEQEGISGIDPGEYVALLSHSGSRGTGAAVCSYYSRIAQSRLPRKYKELGRLAWLGMDTEEGQEYWAAMNLMGDYAAANHEVIHKQVTELLGARVVGGVENHHNFAWEEEHQGQRWIVHRKGATPASEGELGVIPGSMSAPAFVVRGKGHPDSLRSASHGAGRRMSRRAAKSQFHWKSVRKELEARGIHVLSAGSDEVPQVYKDIERVMQQQHDLVDIVARFEPRIVKMCGDGSRAED